MTTEVEICKRALAYIRARSINSMNDQTVEASQCNLFYPFVRDQILALTNWGFLRAQKLLALRPDTVVGWRYVYDYPNDCSMIRRLFSTDAPDLPADLPYEVMNVDGNAVIVCNYENIMINYTMNGDNPALFPVFVQSAMSHLLASEIVIPIIGVEKGNALRLTELQLYNQVINKVMADDGNQHFVEVPQSEFIQVRNNGGNSTEKLYRW